MTTKRKKIKPPFEIELGREDDGRWIAEIPKLPGVMAYGRTRQAALRTVYAIALRTLADKVEHGRTLLPVSHLFNHEMANR
ncbi:MAG: type II toxin-antitoxin system HicB family antitoxin [bacterium]|nr:type II toxin-antitoxin system HicB family antitoxin [bacterium]